MSTKQTSIGSNVVNLGELTERVSTFGVKYNPVRSDFTISNLTALKTSAETLAELVKTAENVDNNSIAARTLSFKNNDGLVTRAINSYKISGASEQSILQAESKVRIYRNIRVSEKPTAEEIAAAKVEGKELRINVHHNSTFDKKIENFADFIDFLDNSSKYRPNETDIAVEGLTAKLTELKIQNSTCSKTSAELDAARMARDTMMFTNGTGMVDIAKGVKQYIKSVFGATSLQYKSISDLKFINIKKITNQATADITTPES